jgi:transcriptional regulator with XRE-family HTH domain
MPSLKSPERDLGDVEARAAHQMLRVVAFAETIRAIPPVGDAGIDVETFVAALRGLAHAGVAQQFSRMGVSRAAAGLERTATAVLDAIEDSPMPVAEWGPLGDVLADDLASLVGVSASSLSRYRSGERSTPDDVAARLHVLAQITSDLAGSYNDFGIRRWFKRPRRALDGQAPNDILHGSWDPRSSDVGRVRDLARTLLGPSIG